MANTIKYKDTVFGIGDTISLTYKFKEGAKERNQVFAGILMKVRGASEASKMITIRKNTKSGIGVERIIPLISPNIADIKLVKKSTNTRAKIAFIRTLSDQKLRQKIYRAKNK